MTEAEWAFVEPMIAPTANRRPPRWVDAREFRNEMFYVPWMACQLASGRCCRKTFHASSDLNGISRKRMCMIRTLEPSPPVARARSPIPSASLGIAVHSNTLWMASGKELENKWKGRDASTSADRNGATRRKHQLRRGTGVCTGFLSCFSRKEHGYFFFSAAHGSMVAVRVSKRKLKRMDTLILRGAETPPTFDSLVDLFKSYKARIGVIGLGYVGLPLTLAACEAGYTVIGFDINRKLVEELNSSKSCFNHIDSARVASARKNDRFVATCDFRLLALADALVICVPTPLGAHREPDLSFVVGTTRTIADHLRRGQLVVLESTTYPGTTREVVKPILETSGLRSEIDFFLAYSPEREDPGNPNFATTQIPKVIAGDGQCALRLASAFYQQFVVSTVQVSSPETAEAVKLTENIFRAVNIALVNELKVVFAALGIDIFEVVDAARTKPFGYMPFYPGPGLGGHCIPIDPFYLTWKARELGINTRFIELAGEINTSMPRHVVDRLREELDARFGKGLHGARILIIGVAYKKNVADMRESPALAVMEQLDRIGAEVDYYDPFIPVITARRRCDALAGKVSIPFEERVLARYDAAVIITDHDEIDYRFLLQYSKLVIDTRNAAALVAREQFAHVLAKA